MAAPVPHRRAIRREYTWNAESVFQTPEAWEAELERVLEAAGSAKDLAERLGEGPAALADVLSAVEDLNARSIRLMVYAYFSSSADTTDQKSAGMNDRAQAATGRVAAAVSFIAPGLIAIGQEALGRWARQEPRLRMYAHYIENLFRKQAHVRSREVEELLGMLSDPFYGPANTAGMLTNADLVFRPARGSWGKRAPVTQGTLEAILESPDRKLRRTAWESYTDRYVELKNTLASNLINSIKQDVFCARTRNHATTLDASLFADNIPAEVFHNVLGVFKRNLPVWHRYFELRSRVLGLREPGHYDMWAPLARRKPHVSYERAVDLICEGLAPMGPAYTDIVRRGCREERWVDVFPNQGKRSGAFSWGARGTHPFIMMSYTGDVSSLSTLAHELGHSMHSYFTWENQPFLYSDYSVFVAEVASNFHQAMVRASLLEKWRERDARVSLLEEAMANFFRYFFIMPTLARFERETHGRIEEGQALTSRAMMDLMADLLEEGYGGRAKVDRRRDGMLWATFPHLFECYYVFQYATGISGAYALAGRILRREPGAVEQYLGFLGSGSSVYPLDALKSAGVDLAGPQPVEETFRVMGGYIDELERLLG